MSAPDDRTLTFTAMASACDARVAGLPPREADRALAAAREEVLRIERAFSRYRADSIVSRINANAGGPWVECDAETLALLDYADALYRDSQGRFDATSGVLRRAWDWRAARLPDAAQVTRLLALVGWPGLQRDGTRVRLERAGMELDFGGFGKEYAADRAAAVLVSHGVRHGFVNLGGDLRAVGPRPDGSPWWIGIQDPRDAARTVASLPLAEGGLATSGDYERFIEVDGMRWHHILDARTGWPVRHWRSVSVRAPLAVAAGAFATIAMLMGPDARAWLDARAVSYLLVGPDGEVTPGGE